MEPRINLITLGVRDLEVSAAFYQRLGFELRPESNPNIRFYGLGGVWLALFPRTLLAEDVHISADGQGFRGFTLAHNVYSPEQVDQVLAEAVAAGATLVKPGQKVFWGGYSGYFSDPDGFLWEVAHNPHFWPG